MLESLWQADLSLTELEQLLPTLREQHDERGKRLSEVERRPSMLGAALQLWEEHSATWESSTRESEAALARLRISHTELTRRFNGLSRSLEGYRLEMRGQVKGLERDVQIWRTLALILGALALALGGLAAVT